ncbi:MULTISPECIES: LON peptidase substrate-binding domain-containing protein [Shewanella]|uniref:LON peptidase substrate-binding domain-containing protein n=1 Tax=Shewanella mangrovisoli TaxID=2864211 RepID=A0ABV4VIE9_9GAMM|nr:MULTISPECIES: LON peptidase substrate-binding domain-containing protein [Shewanella]ABK49931.1 ATP-dependent protease La (LON) domain protein, putative [Shewanella sp. ANA-3]QXN25422.1 ATP-dependent protease [Shewanella putrefaciens]QYJ71034.1 ATP-dependent protease [Shewanella sp. FJAT-51649]QYK08787.1 ATP-dependent protease [Shewanella mangrovisoli]
MQTREMALIMRDALLLPQGRIEVRVVEPGQLRMVADVLKGKYDLAFAAMKPSGTPPCYPTATQCDIIDFNQLEDDSLSIVLEGRQRVSILSAAQTKDKLWMSRTLPCQNWQEEPIEGEFELISAALEQFYEVNPDLLELYSQVHLEDAAWVSQRWLEVLPMYNRDKLVLVNQPDCHKTMDFVLQLIKSHVD